MNFSAKSMPLMPQQLAFIALLLLAFIWGYNWVVMKIAIRDAPAFEFAALRNIFGSLSIFLVMALRRQSLRPQVLWGSALFGLLQSGGSIGLCTWALVQGGAGKTAVLTYTMSFWTLIFAWIFLGERLRGRQPVQLRLAVHHPGLGGYPYPVYEQLHWFRGLPGWAPHHL